MADGDSVPGADGSSLAGTVATVLRRALRAAAVGWGAAGVVAAAAGAPLDGLLMVAFAVVWWFLFRPPSPPTRGMV